MTPEEQTQLQDLVDSFNESYLTEIYDFENRHKNISTNALGRQLVNKIVELGLAKDSYTQIKINKGYEKIL